MDTPYAPTSQTSHAAALAIAPHLNHLEQVVYDTVHAAAPLGLTREMIEDITGLAGNTVRPRCKKLLKLGRIALATWTLPTRSGRQAEVLIAL